GRGNVLTAARGARECGRSSRPVRKNASSSTTAWCSPTPRLQERRFIMATIHTPGDGHTAPTGRHKWLPYSDAKKKKVLEDALFILKNNIKGFAPCNKCFKALPGGKSFDDI